MKLNKSRHSLKTRVENLPNYCKFILIISILIANITIGFSLGILINKNKFENIQKQIENQQKQEELKLDNFLNTHLKK